MTSYTNPIPAGGINPRKLRGEIYSSLSLANQVMVSGVTPSPGSWVTSGDCIVDFAGSLTAGEQTTLAGLVSGHTAGSYAAFPTVAQMALEPGYASQEMFVSDLGTSGGVMLYNGAEWVPASASNGFLVATSSDQTGIGTTPTNITGLSVTLTPGWWEIDLYVLYQSSGTSAGPAIDWNALTNSGIIAEYRMYRGLQGNYTSSITPYYAGLTDEETDVVSSSNVTAATTTYLARCELLVNITANSTLQPRMWSTSGIGATVDVKTGSVMKGKQIYV